MLQLLGTTYSYSASPDNNMTGTVAAVLLFGILLYVIILVIMMVSGWKVFEKAKRPGWGFLVPYHNAVLMLEMAGKPGWWIVIPVYFSLTFMLPLVGLILLVPALAVFVVYYFIAALAFAKAFGKSTGFGVLLALLPWIGLPMLGFGQAQYVGPPKPVAAKSTSA